MKGNTLEGGSPKEKGKHKWHLKVFTGLGSALKLKGDKEETNKDWEAA